MCVDTTTTHHFCGDIMPLFLNGGDAGIDLVNFLFYPALLFGALPPLFLYGWQCWAGSGADSWLLFTCP